MAKARARPTRCCMPPESSWRVLAGPFRQADHAPASRRRCGAVSACGMPRSSSPKPDILAHRPPRQQRELLEHHRDACACADRAASAASQLRDVDRAPPVLDQHAGRASTLLRPLTARRMVDLPEPDRPISTQISPGSTARLTSAAPSTTPVAFEDLVAASCPRRSARAPRLSPVAEDDVDFVEDDGAHLRPLPPLGRCGRRGRARWRAARSTCRPRCPSEFDRAERAHHRRA